MSTKLYVGNLSFDVTENDLRDMLSPHGPVNEVNVVMDRETGRARGFAFATMNTEEGAKVGFLAAVTDDLVKKGLHAGKLTLELLQS